MMKLEKTMNDLGFEWTQGNLYISKSEKDNLSGVYRVVNKLSNINWFKESVKDIRAFKVDDLSDFLEIVKNKL